MSTEATTNLAAVCERAGAPLKLEHRPIPILVRSHAVGANPVDSKVATRGYAIPNLPSVLGSDIAGTVDAVGASVTLVKPGDRVLAFAAVMINGNPDCGAWQYVRDPLRFRVL